MLNLRRKVGGEIRIVHRSGESVVVRLARVHGNQVTLAIFDEPRHFEIIRPEQGSQAGQRLVLAPQKV
jgi:sRNA-binding carbon storage regulator CsrA